MLDLLSYFNRTSPKSRTHSQVPQRQRQNPPCISRCLAPWPLPVLPTGSALCWLRGDRLVWLDHLPPWLQRLPLHRLLSVPSGGQPQSHQPCHCALHHARTQTLQRRWGALLRSRKTPVHQPTVLRWWGERGPEAVWRYGGAELWLSLTGCAPPALLNTETEGDRNKFALFKLFSGICFKYFIILTNKTSIPQTTMFIKYVDNYLTLLKLDGLACVGQAWMFTLILKTTFIPWDLNQASWQTF